MTIPFQRWGERESTEVRAATRTRRPSVRTGRGFRRRRAIARRMQLWGRGFQPRRLVRTPNWCLVVAWSWTRISAFGAARISALVGSMPQAAAVLVVTRRTNSHNCHVRCGALWGRPPSWHRLSPGCMPVELKQSRHVVVAILEVRVSGVAVSPRQCARKTCRRHRRGERSCTEPKAHERVSCAAISGFTPVSCRIRCQRQSLRA